jgi:hypothetical protein
LTQQGLYTLLSSTGIATCYQSWKASGITETTELPALPWICYLFVDNDGTEAADNKVHQKVNNYLVELYTNKKDIASEELLEDALDSASIFYNKAETYIEDQALFEVAYSIQI